MRFIITLPWLIIFLLTWSCARQTSPTGGPKDTIPPVLLKDLSIPKNGALNYKSQLVQLEFNEAIILNNPKEQIIITPDVQKKYTITARKKTVKLEFENPLKDTTTYAIYFRQAVQDITEKNSVHNLKVAFSTGSYIDSLSFSGRVYDPLVTTELKNITVAVYTTDTFNIFKHKPVYITQSDDKGKYSIENLKPGNYYIYAIDDRNRNLIADSKSEMYGFIPEKITLRENKTNIDIPIQKLDARPLKLTSIRPYNTYFNIKTSKHTTSYKLKTHGDLQLSSTYGEDHTSIKVYNNIGVQDSIAATLTATDSASNQLDTTFYVKFSTRKATPESFTVTPGTFNVLHTRGTFTGAIQFNKPLKHITYDSIAYQIDSLTTINFDSTNVTWDSITNILTLHRSIDKKLIDRSEDPKTDQMKKIYQLVIGNGAFISIENDSSKALTPVSVKPQYLEDLGILFVNVQTSEPHFLVQLLDKSFKILRTERDRKKIAFEDLPPSDYQLRLIIDSNNDGIWTPANFDLKRPAEQVQFYKSEKGLYSTKLKANFEIGPLLITF